MAVNTISEAAQSVSEQLLSTDAVMFIREKNSVDLNVFPPSWEGHRCQYQIVRSFCLLYLHLCSAGFWAVGLEMSFIKVSHRLARRRLEAEADVDMPLF